MKVGEFVIYIQGAATGVVQDGDIERGIREDDAMAARNIKALRDSGHTVLHIGNGRDGFSLAELYREVQAFPRATTFIIDAHGNEEGRDPDGEALCSIRCGPIVNDVAGEEIEDANCHTAGEVFEVITNSTLAQPVNVFLLCCGSRLAPRESDKLVRGSTLVTFTSLNSWQNSSPPDAGFSVPYVRARNFAEQLCLNMQASMEAYENILSIAVVRDDLPAEARDFSMWNQAMIAGFTEPHHDVPGDFVRTMRKRCAPYMGNATFNAIIGTLQLQAQHNFSSTLVEDPRTPVTVRVTSQLDRDSFRADIERQGLMGALGVYAYLLGEEYEPLGAFQTQPESFYTTPRPTRPDGKDRPSPFAKLGLDLSEQGVLEALVQETAARIAAKLAENRGGPG